jgi:hypothetical protein
MLVRSIVPPGCGAGTQAGYVMLNDIPMRVDEATYVCELYAEAYSSKVRKKENRMRTVMAAILAMTAPAAMADDLDDSHLALSGRDSYWHCLAICRCNSRASTPATT